jgi:hypothetical protein
MSTHGGWLDDVDVYVPGQLPLPGVLLERTDTTSGDDTDQHGRVVTLQPLEAYL